MAMFGVLVENMHKLNYYGLFIIIHVNYYY
jgi:hypothetical protein